MSTVSDLSDPLFFGRVKDPVIFEECCHTFGREGVLGSIYTDVRDRISRWDFLIPQGYDCPICKHTYRIDQVVVNDSWEKLDGLLEQFIQSERGEQTAEAFQETLSDMPLIDLKRWELEKAYTELRTDWQLAHFGKRFEDLLVIDYLKWKDSPLVSEAFSAWKEVYPSARPDLLHLEELLKWKNGTLRASNIEVFNAVRPAHLIGVDTDSYDEEKIRKAETRKPVFPREEWSYFESLQFIVASIYHLAVATICEFGLAVLYLWECGFITTEKYNKLRTEYVVNRIVPRYLTYMGLPPEKPKTH